MLKRVLLALFLSSLALYADEEVTIKEAYADIYPTQGNQVEGRVVFQVEESGVRVVAHIKGLKPGEHGFHIHESGDCSAPDGSSAGGHFNPFQHPHGSPDSPKRHVGDLGNIKAGDDGYAIYDRFDALLKLEGPNSIIGRAVIVHADPDDYTTQPTGNAGARLGCGVIRQLPE